MKACLALRLAVSLYKIPRSNSTFKKSVYMPIFFRFFLPINFDRIISALILQKYTD